MPRLSDPAAIRALLETDRPWAAYALADLAPGFFEFCEWHAEWRASPPPPALLLLYRAFEIPVLVALGTPTALAPLLEEIEAERQLYLSVQPEVLPLIHARYTVEAETAMWRMALEPADFRPAPTGETVRLGASDLPALQQLYADGQAAGEAPDFFNPAMVTQGIFFGVREGQALIAAAGTHLYTAQESAGTVGNVYTRRDQRGRGLAGRVTGAVTAELLKLGLRTIVLNVAQHNAAALRVYARLGFVRYCAFYEGHAQKRP